jgi:hypothetical protein
MLSGASFRASASARYFDTASRIVGISGFDDSDGAGGFPAAHAVGRGLPGGEIETPANNFAAERALHPDRTRATIPSPSLRTMRTIVQVATVDGEHCFTTRVPPIRYVLRTRSTSRLSTHCN